MFGAPANPAPDPKITMPPRPRSAIGPARWWQSCMGTVQLRCTMDSAVSSELSRKCR